MKTKDNVYASSRIVLFVLSFLSLLSTAVIIVNATTLSFNDVPADSYFADAVEWALDSGITTGTSAAKFSPSATCTRGQVVTFLWRAKGQPEPNSEHNPFRDVSAADYYYKSVLWAVQNGITNGTSDTAFSPASTCTQAQVITFLWRALGQPSANGKSEYSSLYYGKYYADSVAWADTNGLLSNMGNTKFDAEHPCPRSDIVTYLYRFDNISYVNVISITPSLALFSSDTETKIRDFGKLSASVLMNTEKQYVSLVFSLANNSSSDFDAKRVNVSIDGGEGKYWADFTLASGKTTQLHVYGVNMRKLGVGKHTAVLYGNGELLCSASFTLTNDPEKTEYEFILPTQAQIASHNKTATERAPYAAYGVTFAGKRFSEYSIDFRANDQPDYTYLCPLSFQIDISSVKDSYAKIDPYRSAYAGFQVTDNNKKIAIMSIWDTAYVDKNGNSGLIRSKVTYHNPDLKLVEIVDNIEEFGGYTSSFVSCRIEFDWQECHWYRALLQRGKSAATGNDTLQFWVRDMVTGKWYYLMEFDLNMKGTSLNGFGGFLENWSPITSGQVRTMELKNIRANNVDTGKWENATSVNSMIKATVLGEYGGSGSWLYSCDGEVFSAITSGVPGLSYDQPNDLFPITVSESGSPF